MGSYCFQGEAYLGFAISAQPNLMRWEPTCGVIQWHIFGMKAQIVLNKKEKHS